MSEISREAVFEVWVNKIKPEKFESVLTYVLTIFGRDVDNEKLKTRLRKLCYDFEVRWSKSRRSLPRFMHQNSDWLKVNIYASEFILDVAPSNSKRESTCGRKDKKFSECCPKTKQRKCKELISQISTDHLIMAAELKIRSCGKRDSANLVNELANSSPSRGTSIKRSRICKLEIKRMSADQALAMIIDTNLSMHDYDELRQHSKILGPKLYPCYDLVRSSKMLCYPRNITVSETYAEISLQSLIDHTVERLINAQEEVFKAVPDIKEEISIIIKWGCDGAEQSRYKQKFADPNLSDESLFSICMVPLQLCSTIRGEKQIYWQNPAPSSTRYCRPIKFVFAKETRDVIINEVKHIQDQILALTPTSIQTENFNFKVRATLVLCMIDGKVCNALSTYKSSQACYLCGATPKLMNSIISLSERDINADMLAFGLSPLHAWIRFMECVLHISYRLEIKKWYVTGEANKAKVAERKKEIQTRFRNETGLLVDMPKQNTGNTNDGNTARRFFKDAVITSDITGINLNLINKFCTILTCIGSGYSINIPAFQRYTEETTELYLSEYSWYYMPVTVHKILYHGKDIISSCILPIGNFSEEAQESRNKDARKYRELFTRKTSRVDTNTDLLHRLLISSDPFIGSLRRTPKTKRRDLSAEVVQLLLDYQYNEDNSDNEE